MNKAIQSVIAVGMLFLAIGCGKDADKPGTEPGKAAVTDIATIATAPDRRALVGRRVDIASAPAMQVVGNYVFWSGEGFAAVPVVRMDKIKGPVNGHVRKGDRIRMTGVVRLMSSVSTTDPMWDKINDREKADMQAAIVYIEADAIQVIPKAFDVEVQSTEELADGELPEC